MPISSTTLFASLHAVGALALCWAVATLLRIDGKTRPAALVVALGLYFLTWNGLQAALLFQTDAASILSITRFSFGLASIGIPVVYWLSCIILQCATQRLITIRIHLMVGVTWAMLSAGTPWVVVSVSPRPWGLGANLGPLALLQTLWLVWMINHNVRDHLSAWARPQISSENRKRLVLNGTSCFAVYLLLFYVFQHVPPLSAAARVIALPASLVAIPLFLATGVHIIRNYWLSEVDARAAAKDMADLFEGVVLVLDDAGTIRYANAQCSDILGMPPERLIGQRSRDALGQSFGLDHLLELSRASGRSAHYEMSWQNPRTSATHQLDLSARVISDERQRRGALVCLATDITQRRREQQGLRDPLTGLPQRGPFLATVEAALGQIHNQSQPYLALCFLGIARMRVINEDLGYAIGDRVLVETARRIREAIRPQDSVARLGGDEFGVLLSQPLDPISARNLVQALQRAVQAPIERPDHALYLTVSIGVVECFTMERAEGLLRKAELGLQKAKMGGLRLEWVKGEPVTGSRTRLESELRQALAQGEFVPYYQPVVDVQRGCIVGFEALVRWHHPTRGMVLPGEFIGMAEQTGLVSLMDRMMLATACRDLRKLQLAVNNPDLSMSLNLDGQVLMQAQVVAAVESALRTSGIRPSSLRIEVLERLTLDSSIREVLIGLRRLGVGLYVDDFGTGSSSLSRLHELPVTALKIDHTFVRGMSAGKGGRVVVHNIIDLAINLELDVVAEGVSSLAELEALVDAGCHQLQGFFFSEAMPLEAALQQLQQPIGQLRAQKPVQA